MTPLFELSDRAGFVIVIGATTALFRATSASCRTTSSAWSRIRPVAARLHDGRAGVAPIRRIFHLMTHAFFKALLFLGAGSVIIALHHEQDMRKMGGVKEKTPQTFILMWIGTLALSGIGVPFIMGHGVGFAGFYSKDAILEASFGAHSTVGMIAYWLGASWLPS